MFGCCHQNHVLVTLYNLVSCVCVFIAWPIQLIFYLLVQKNSLCTIKNNANVCSVQFSAHSTHLLAFSSADYKTYCYDLRNTSMPWCVLADHEKAVSYAKFLDAGTLVTASTDNTLKIWDLNKTSPNSLSRDACILTLKGHTNEKVSHIFLGLVHSRNVL